MRMVFCWVLIIFMGGVCLFRERCCLHWFVIVCEFVARARILLKVLLVNDEVVGFVYA